MQLEGKQGSDAFGDNLPTQHWNCRARALVHACFYLRSTPPSHTRVCEPILPTRWAPGFLTVGDFKQRCRGGEVAPSYPPT
jgi:hypothetical protein